MNPNDINVLMLESVAQRLGDDLLGELVFIGGAVAGLLITDPAMPAIRPTEDVDLLAQALTLADYHRVEKTLAERGFEHDMSPDAPIGTMLGVTMIMASSNAITMMTAAMVAVRGDDD